MTQTIDLRKKESPTPAAPNVEAVAPVPPEREIEPEKIVSADGIHWSAHLNHRPHRNRTGYFIGGLLVTAGLVAYFAQDFLFTIVLILAAVVLALNLTRPHRKSQISVHATGISINDQQHFFSNIRSFWIDYEPRFNIKELSIELRKGYIPRIRIPIENTNPLELRQAMMVYVPEKEHRETLLDHMIRMLEI